MNAVEMNGSAAEAPFADDFEVLDERYRDADNDPPPPAATAKTLSEHVALQSRTGAVVRLATGIPTLDACMRGGVPVPRFVVIGGAPGAGKTSLVCRLAYQWAKAGFVVGIMAVDEGPEGIVDRVALYESAKRDLLDAGDTREWARLATAVDGLPLLVDDGAMTVEAFAEHIRSVAGDKPAVMISDSLQTVRCQTRGEGQRESRREQIDHVVRAHKRAAAQHNLLVIATCELSRAFYRSEALAKELNPLAAFKETGSIEYSAQTALVLTTPKGAHDLVDVTVAKNRGYRKEPFRLQMHTDLSFHETERPAEDDDDEAVGDREDPKLERQAVAVLLIIANAPGIGSRELRTECAVAKLEIGKDRLPVVIRHLERTGRVQNRPEHHKSRVDPHYFAVAVTP